MIKSRYSYLCSLLLVSLIIGFSSAAQNAAHTDSGSNNQNYIAQGEHKGSYWPTNGWRTCKPEAVGMDSQKLSEAFEYAAISKFNTKGVVVIKDGYIVAEAYFGKFRRDSKHVGV